MLNPFFQYLLKQQPVPASVFHYTPAEGLCGILESKVFWASDASGLNGRAEVERGQRLVQGLLKDHCPCPGRELLLNPPNWGVRRQRDVFILSASTHGDDSNQWRSYAGLSGYAVELGTESTLLVQSDYVEPPPGVTDAWRQTARDVRVSPWVRVYYDREPVRGALEFLIDQASRLDATAKESSQSQDYSDYFQGEYDELLDRLGSLAHLVKEPGFRGEREVRVVVTAAQPDHHIKHRAGSRGIISYLRLTTAKDTASINRMTPEATALPVKSVTLGPSLPIQHQGTVKRLLRMTDHAQVVKFSGLSVS